MRQQFAFKLGQWDEKHNYCTTWHLLWVFLVLFSFLRTRKALRNIPFLDGKWTEWFLPTISLYTFAIRVLSYLFKSFLINMFKLGFLTFIRGQVKYSFWLITGDVLRLSSHSKFPFEEKQFMYMYPDVELL